MMRNYFSMIKDEIKKIFEKKRIHIEVGEKIIKRLFELLIIIIFFFLLKYNIIIIERYLGFLKIIIFIFAYFIFRNIIIQLVEKFRYFKRFNNVGLTEKKGVDLAIEKTPFILNVYEEDLCDLVKKDKKKYKKIEREIFFYSFLLRFFSFLYKITNPFLGFFIANSKRIYYFFRYFNTKFENSKILKIFHFFFFEIFISPMLKIYFLIYKRLIKGEQKSSVELIFMRISGLIFVVLFTTNFLNFINSFIYIPIYFGIFFGYLLLILIEKIVPEEMKYSIFNYSEGYDYELRKIKEQDRRKEKRYDYSGSYDHINDLIYIRYEYTIIGNIMMELKDILRQLYFFIEDENKNHYCLVEMKYYEGYYVKSFENKIFCDIILRNIKYLKDEHKDKLSYIFCYGGILSVYEISIDSSNDLLYKCCNLLFMESVNKLDESKEFKKEIENFLNEYKKQLKNLLFLLGDIYDFIDYKYDEEEIKGSEKDKAEFGKFIVKTKKNEYGTIAMNGYIEDEDDNKIEISEEEREKIAEKYHKIMELGRKLKIKKVKNNKKIEEYLEILKYFNLDNLGLKEFLIIQKRSEYYREFDDKIKEEKMEATYDGEYREQLWQECSKGIEEFRGEGEEEKKEGRRGFIIDERNK